MRFLVLSLMINFATQLEAKNMIDHSDWSYLADTVMGGVSTGEARIENLDKGRTIHLTGSVSTENNGGFIQVRANVGAGSAKGLKGVRLLVKGNSDSYYIHLRTSGSMLPWHYYQQEFKAPNKWIEIKLPFSDFEPSSLMLRKKLDVGGIKTLGVVANGKDYEADIWLAEVDFY